MRTRAHEYGGGAYTLHPARDTLLYTDFKSQDLLSVPLAGGEQPAALGEQTTSPSEGNSSKMSFRKLSFFSKEEYFFRLKRRIGTKRTSFRFLPWEESFLFSLQEEQAFLS